MAIHELVVNGTQYNCVDASAVDQKTMMSMLAPRLTYNLGANTEVRLDENFIFGALVAMPEDEFDKLAKLALYKTVLSGGGSLVTVDDFQGEIMSYYLLVAKAVESNISDFLAWLDVARKPEATSEATTQVTSTGS